LCYPFEIASQNSTAGNKLGDSKRSTVPRKGESLTGAAVHGCTARYEGGGGRSKQDVYDWNPESPCSGPKRVAFLLER